MELQAMSRTDPQRPLLLPLSATLFLVAVLVCPARPTPYPSGSSWTPARVVGMPYVADARDARVSGVVRLRCSLSADGSVRDVQVLLGHPVLTRRVAENARHWRFMGPENATVPNPTALLIYEFKLTGPTCGGKYHDGFTFDWPDRVTITSEYPCFEPDRSTRGSKALH